MSTGKLHCFNYNGIVEAEQIPTSRYGWQKGREVTPESLKRVGFTLTLLFHIYPKQLEARYTQPKPQTQHWSSAEILLRLSLKENVSKRHSRCHLTVPSCRLHRDWGTGAGAWGGFAVLQRSDHPPPAAGAPRHKAASMQGLRELPQHPAALAQLTATQRLVTIRCLPLAKPAAECTWTGQEKKRNYRTRADRGIQIPRFAPWLRRYRTLGVPHSIATRGCLGHAGTRTSRCTSPRTSRCVGNIAASFGPEHRGTPRSADTVPRSEETDFIKNNYRESHYKTFHPLEFMAKFALNLVEREVSSDQLTTCTRSRLKSWN